MTAPVACDSSRPMADPDTEDEATSAPFTTDELTDSQLDTLSLPDQILYAVYNRNCYLDDIVPYTSFSAEWTADMVDDLVTDGDLETGFDGDDVKFYTLPEHKRNTLTDAGREEIHAEARRVRASETRIGDDHDIKAAVAEPDTEEYAHSMPSSETDDDTVDLDAAEGPSPDEVAAAIDDHGGLLPVDRGYDWDSEVIPKTGVEPYVSSNGEYDDMTHEIEDRRETGKLPHFRICGPTGCGKTSLAENIALGMNAPVFEINCHDGLRPSNLLGMPTYVGDETWWIDGPLPKALLASQERPVVLLFDEVNRTPSQTLGVIMSVLDHQCRLTLNARGGEVIRGDPMNLIVFSTMNEGEGYTVHQIDRAQKRRFGNTYYTDYLGMDNIEDEAALIADRTPVSESLATDMVSAANEIRKKSAGSSAVSMGVPTSTMLDWARTAWSYRDDDCDGGPLIKAAQRAVVNPFFRGDQQEEDIVTTTLESHLRGMAVHEDDDPDEDDESAETADEKHTADTESEPVEVSDETWLMCENCGWYEATEDASEEVVTTMSCPECASTIVPKEAT